MYYGSFTGYYSHRIFIGICKKWSCVVRPPWEIMRNHQLTCFLPALFLRIFNILCELSGEGVYTQYISNLVNQRTSIYSFNRPSVPWHAFWGRPLWKVPHNFRISSISEHAFIFFSPESIRCLSIGLLLSYKVTRRA